METDYQLITGKDNVYGVEAEKKIVLIGKEEDFALFVLRILKEEEIEPCQVREVVHNLQVEEYVLA